MRKGKLSFVNLILVWAVMIITISLVLKGSLKMQSSSQQAAQMKTCSSKGEESVARIAMPGALKMFPGWFSSLAQKNLGDCLAAAGGRSATGNLYCRQQHSFAVFKGKQAQREMWSFTTVHKDRCNCWSISIKQMQLHLQTELLPVVKECQKFMCKSGKQLEEKPAFETVAWALLLKSLSSLLWLWTQKGFSPHLGSSVSLFNSSLMMIIY